MSSPPPAAPVVDAVALLERAVAYACGTLATATLADLSAPTPCVGWRLVELLSHMEDSLDAFGEAAGGSVDAHRSAPTPPTDLLPAIRAKATGLVGAWTPHTTTGAAGAARAAEVRLGVHTLPSATLAGLAAVEVAVHGWDVGRATHAGGAMPTALARDLEPWAHRLVLEDLQAAVRGVARQFAPPWEPAAASRDPATRLLGLLGRRTR